MASRVYVTTAQRQAAQALIQRDKAEGRRTPESVKKIANARTGILIDAPTSARRSSPVKSTVVEGVQPRTTSKSGKSQARSTIAGRFLGNRGARKSL